LTGHILTEAAECDLRDIIRYTAKQWGQAQARHYMGNLKRDILSLAEGHGTFKIMNMLYPELRMARSGRHYIFCLPRKGRPPMIVAVLHERMDVLQRLAGRI